LNINIPVVRPVLTVFLILALGYTTLLAWGNHLTLRGGVRVLMTVMLGITLVVVSGFILNFTSWGLETRAWVFLLSAIILFNSGLAMLRKQAVPTDVAPTSIQTWKLDLRLGQVALLALAAIITAASLFIARNGAVSQPRPGYSQLWMVDDGTANTSQAVLGVKNEEQQPTSYHLVVMQGTTVIQDFPAFSLAPDQTWQGKVNLTGITPTTDPVEAVLYRGDDQTEPYRSVNLWLQ